LFKFTNIKRDNLREQVIPFEYGGMGVSQAKRLKELEKEQV